uniref:Major facilitator superfamily (MFS) profile domain-containing protein n=1 Tax=Musca domestica TaxID=7370 RepID=A0A1I8N9P3_MUSDO
MSLRQRTNNNNNNNVVEGSTASPDNTHTTADSNKKNAEQQERTNPMVYIVFISLLFDLLAFTIILPLLPSLLEYFKNNDSSGLYAVLTDRIKWFQELVGAPDRYNSVLFGGLLGSMFSFCSFLASPIVGGLSDCYGRKPVIILCAAGIALSYLLWAFSRNFAVFVLARFVGGLSKGNISLSMSIITDVSSGKTRGRGMALVGVAFSLGFIVGPMIGALFAIFSNKSTGPWFVLPSLLALALALGDLLILVFCLKETLPKEKRVKEISSSMSYAFQLINVSSIFRFASIKNVPQKQIKSLQTIGMIYFVYLFLYSALEFTVTFLMYHKFGYTSMDQAKMFLTTGIIMTILQGSVVRRLPEKDIKNYAVFSLYLLIPAFAIVGIAHCTCMLYIGMILYAISTAFTVTCLTTLVSKYGNDDQKGSVLGIFRSLGALARAMGPVVGCIAFWCIGSKLTYVSGGLLLLIPAYVLQKTQLA